MAYATEFLHLLRARAILKMRLNELAKVSSPSLSQVPRYFISAQERERRNLLIFSLQHPERPHMAQQQGDVAVGVASVVNCAEAHFAAVWVPLRGQPPPPPFQPLQVFKRPIRAGCCFQQQTHTQTHSEERASFSPHFVVWEAPSPCFGSFHPTAAKLYVELFSLSFSLARTLWN